MPDVAKSRLAGNLGIEAGAVHGVRKELCHLADGAVLAAADVVDLSRRLLVLESESEGLRYVLDMDEVPALLAVLEDHRRLAVVEPRREDCQHARVGVRERLARAVDVPQAQGDAL